MYEMTYVIKNEVHHVMRAKTTYRFKRKKNQLCGALPLRSAGASLIGQPQLTVQAFYLNDLSSGRL
jgi:hypothetical protein